MAIPTITPYQIPDGPFPQRVDWKLEPSRAALLIHDMQNYFIDAYDTQAEPCLLYTSPSPRDATLSRMPSSA